MNPPPPPSALSAPLVPRPPPSLLSLVIPVFNESETLPHLERALQSWMGTCGLPVEVILVDDGSSDGSALRLLDWASRDPRAKVLLLSRNFGHQLAVTAGLQHASGEAVVILDADLQDPLSTIPEMVAAYLEGYDIAYGRRQERLGESWLKRATATAFYRLLRAAIAFDLPADTGDFRLVSRRALNAILSMPESSRFLRGMWAWVGFPQKAIDYTRQPRQYGRTKYPWLKMLRFAWNATVSFSTAPIKAISLAGFAIALFGFAYGFYSVLNWAIWHDVVRGWTTLVVLLALIGGTLLISLGIIGEYVARIYEEVKRRPLFLIRQTANLETRPNQPTGSGVSQGEVGHGLGQ